VAEAEALPVRGTARAGCLTVSASMAFMSACARFASASLEDAMEGREPAVPVGFAALTRDWRGTGGLGAAGFVTVLGVAAAIDTFFGAAFGGSTGLTCNVRFGAEAAGLAAWLAAADNRGTAGFVAGFVVAAAAEGLAAGAFVTPPFAAVVLRREHSQPS
jgi:hypothetical protein